MRRRWWSSRLVRALFALAVVAALTLTLRDQWHGVGHRMARLGPGDALGAVLLMLLGLQLAMLAWRVLLADLGAPVPIGAGARIFFVGQLGKYLPGSVWPLLAQMEMGAGYGLQRVRLAAAYVVGTTVSAITGALVGLLALPGLLGGRGHARYLLVLLVVPVGVAVLHPRVLNALLARALRLLRRGPLEHRLSGRALLRAGGLCLLSWLAWGLQVYVLAAAVGGAGARTATLAVGGFALAAVTGLVVILAPAGAGVREAVLIVVLATVMPVAAATAVALLSRLAATAGDGLAAGGAVLAARGGWRRSSR